MKVSEIFYSIQGEGLNSGMPQVFVRLFGCNLRCVWCDSKYAMIPEGYMDEEARKIWRSSAYEELTPRQVVDRIEKWPSMNICITGGEPLVQQKELLQLLRLLQNWNYYIQLFTNGSIWEPDSFRLCDMISMDMKPPSSGMQKKSILTFMEWLDHLRDTNGGLPEFEIKVVVQTQEDLEFALFKVYPKCPTTLILQPCVVDPTKELETLQSLTEVILNYNLKDVRVLPQLHKLIWPKEWRGK